MSRKTRKDHVDGHEYYAHSETSRNRMFDLFDKQNQIEDWHLSFYGEEDID